MGLPFSLPYCRFTARLGTRQMRLARKKIKQRKIRPYRQRLSPRVTEGGREGDPFWTPPTIMRKRGLNRPVPLQVLHVLLPLHLPHRFAVISELFPGCRRSPSRTFSLHRPPLQKLRRNNTFTPGKAGDGILQKRVDGIEYTASAVSSRGTFTFIHTLYSY